jgi:hypothetical protein
VIDVAHDRNDRGTRQQILSVVSDVGHHALLLEGGGLDAPVELGGNQLRRIEVDRRVDHHAAHPKLPNLLENVGRLKAHLSRQLGDDDGFVHLDHTLVLSCGGDLRRLGFATHLRLLLGPSAHRNLLLWRLAQTLTGNFLPRPTGSSRIGLTKASARTLGTWLGRWRCGRPKGRKVNDSTRWTQSFAGPTRLCSNKDSRWRCSFRWRLGLARRLFYLARRLRRCSRHRLGSRSSGLNRLSRTCRNRSNRWLGSRSLLFTLCDRRRWLGRCLSRHHRLFHRCCHRRYHRFRSYNRGSGGGRAGHMRRHFGRSC